MKVLAAEDYPVLRLVLVRALRKLGHEIVEAANGLAAWDCLQAHPSRIVISDWMIQVSSSSGSIAIGPYGIRTR
jgi:CheY-like chemotaxis protein